MCSVQAWGQQTGPEQTPFQDLRGGLARLREEDLEAAPASAMGEDIAELRRHINGCEAEFTRRLKRFDTGHGYAASGALNPKPWLRWQCHLSPSAASDRVEVSRLLASLPETTDSFAEGEISYQHAAMIARTAEKLGEKMVSDAETILVTAAKEMDPARLRVACLQLRHCLDPDAVLADANEANELRYLYLSQTLDGVFYLNGRLDAEGGASLQTALNALSGPRPQTTSEHQSSGAPIPWWSWRANSWTAANCPKSGASGRTWRSPSTWRRWPSSRGRGRPSSSGRSQSLSKPPGGSPVTLRSRQSCVALNRISRTPAARRAFPLVRSARRWWSGTRAAASQAATGHPIGLMRITSSTGRTAARRRWTTCCCYAGGITAWSTKKAGRWPGMIIGSCSRSRLSPKLVGAAERS